MKRPRPLKCNARRSGGRSGQTVAGGSAANPFWCQTIRAHLRVAGGNPPLASILNPVQRATIEVMSSHISNGESSSFGKAFGVAVTLGQPVAAVAGDMIQVEKNRAVDGTVWRLGQVVRRAFIVQKTRLRQLLEEVQLLLVFSVVGCRCFAAWVVVVVLAPLGKSFHSIVSRRCCPRASSCSCSVSSACFSGLNMDMMRRWISPSLLTSV